MIKKFVSKSTPALGEKLSIINKIVPYIKMLRPEISFMDLTLPAAAAMLAAFCAAGSLPPTLLFLLAVIGGFFAITSSYIFNDCFDVDIDTINLPNRPIPSGAVSWKQAFIYATALALIAISISFYLSRESFGVLLIALAVITLYSVFFKRTTPFSFVFVGIAYGLVPIGIWLAFDPAGFIVNWKLNAANLNLPIPAILFGLMICMTDWGFTLAGVSRDLEGDKAKGAPTLPVTYGIPFTSKFILMIWMAGLLLSLGIGYAAGLGPLYFIIALLSGFWMIGRCLRFIKNPEPELGGKLFIEGSNYRGIMFSAMIMDILLSIFITSYPSIFNLMGG